MLRMCTCCPPGHLFRCALVSSFHVARPTMLALSGELIGTMLMCAQDALLRTPPHTTLAFASWSSKKSQSVKDMQRLQRAFSAALAAAAAAAAKLGNHNQETTGASNTTDVALPKLHFLSQPVKDQAPWLVATLHHWTQNTTTVTALGTAFPCSMIATASPA